MTDPRVIFAGTPDFALAALRALVESGRMPVAVLTQPDRRAGRGKKLTGPLPFLRLPPRDGRTWKVTFSDVKQHAVFQIGRGKVSVPAGEFDTITLRIDFFEQNAKKLTHLYWFAKNVGIVKQSIFLTESKVSYELMEYMIK